jgi:hypothetical protein
MNKMIWKKLVLAVKLQITIPQLVNKISQMEIKVKEILKAFKKSNKNLMILKVK